MWKVIRKYYGELCEEKSIDCESCEQETVFSSSSFKQALKEFYKWLKEDKKAGYVIDEEADIIDLLSQSEIRLFFQEQENWNNYIEMSIINQK